MSLFNLPADNETKSETVHPWSKSIKDVFSHRIKTAHNAVSNVVYPKPKKGRVPKANRIKFSVIGNRVTKEFLYCVHMVNAMHKYRWKYFDTPVIRSVTGVEWLHVLQDLKLEYGGLAYCLQSQVAVICNGKILGGEKELKEMIELNYVYYICLDYQKECVKMFLKFVKSTGRSFAYLHIGSENNILGTLIFMLYTDIVPNTCENFLRLCNKKKGGYGGTPVHRIVEDCFIQCGGFALKDTPMNCENFIVPHDRRGVLGMANAGRHIDCSTQFYVLLQPNESLNHRFVAFGQLVDGEKTLELIEKQPTYYESPIHPITIIKCGMLNLDCKEITINKGTYEYIQQHIEDLVDVGELFTRMLLEHVFLEIEFRYLSTLEPQGGEGEEQERITVLQRESNMRATQRFMRKKEEIQNQIAKNVNGGMRASCASYAASNRSKKDKDDDNSEFDVEEYEYIYEPEDYLYPQAELPVQPHGLMRPYYIPLTDVPYPGEVDSNFDLKRFLQGDYCLETDLDPKLKRTSKIGQAEQDKISAISEVIMSYKHGDWEEVEEESSASDMDDEDEKEISRYLMENGERVSFSGAIIRKIAHDYVKINPIEERSKFEVFTDEDIRRIKLAQQDLKARYDKKVSINVEPWETHTKIKRRQTGLPLDLPKPQQARPEEDSDGADGDADTDADEDYRRDETRAVSISLPRDESPAHQIKRKQTGFALAEDLAKLHNERKISEEEDDSVEEAKTGKEVRIASGPALARVKTESERFHSMSFDENATPTRPSVLVRLLEDVAMHDNERVPTLKDYKPMSEMKFKKNMMLTMSAARPLFSDDDLEREQETFRKENYLRASIVDENQSSQMLALMSGKKIARKPSADFGKVTDHFDTRAEKSIRTMDFHKSRPTLSVSQYRLKNQQEAEERKKSGDEKTEVQAGFKRELVKSVRTGIRLPGDTPISGSFECADNESTVRF